MDKWGKLDKYLDSLENTDLSERTKENTRLALTRYMNWLGDKEICLDTVNTYMRDLKKKGLADTTLYHHKAILKKFLSKIDPEGAKEIKLKMKKREPPIILTPKEIEQLINACMNARDRAFISFLYESGCRQGEILSIRIETVNFNEYGAMVTMKGKTGPRTIQVIYSASYLRAWKDVHPLRDIENAPFFCSLKPPHVTISETGIRHIYEALKERTGIKKRIYSHLFRHSRATHLSKSFTESQLKVFLGWSPRSSMPAVYVNLSGVDMEDAVLKLHGIESRQTGSEGFKVGICPRCKEVNPETFSFCGKCGMPLTSSSQKTEQSEHDEFDIQFSRLINTLSYMKLF
jgi:site-specific recombinase XerD